MRSSVECSLAHLHALPPAAGIGHKFLYLSLATSNKCHANGEVNAFNKLPQVQLPPHLCNVMA
jgi:hypothetical protein